MKRLAPRVLVDRKKPGRRIEFIDLGKVERALGRRIRHVYHNTIQPGAVAGDHWHKGHAVALDMRRGCLDLVLEDVKTGKVWKGRIREGEALMLIPGYEYHAARNPGPGVAQATMYATTPPRNEGDSFHYEPRVRLFAKRRYRVSGGRARTPTTR